MSTIRQLPSIDFVQLMEDFIRQKVSFVTVSLKSGISYNKITGYRAGREPRYSDACALWSFYIDKITTTEKLEPLPDIDFQKVMLVTSAAGINTHNFAIANDMPYCRAYAYRCGNMPKYRDAKKIWDYANKRLDKEELLTCLTR